MKKWIIVAICAVAVIAAGFLFYTKVIGPTTRYTRAMEDMRAGRYEEAEKAFGELAEQEYRDANLRRLEAQANRLFDSGDYSAVVAMYEFMPVEYLDHANDLNAIYADACEKLESGRYDEAVGIFTSLGNFKDSAEQIREADYRKAGSLAEGGKYGEAADLYEALGDYKDSVTLAAQARADALYAEGDTSGALDLYSGLDDDYQTHQEDYREAYRHALELLEGGRYAEAEAEFSALGSYSDAEDQMKTARYMKAKALASGGKYDEAIAAYESLGDFRDSASLAVKAAADKMYDEGDTAGAYDLYQTVDKAYRTHREDYARLYAEAEKALANHDYDGAKEQFLKLGRYSNSAERAAGCDEAHAAYLRETGNYEEAYELYQSLGRTDEADRTLYLQAGSLAAEGRREEAAEMYRRLGEYGDSAVRLKQLEADGLYADGDLAGAWEIYATLDAAYRTHEADYAARYAGAEQALENHEYETAQEAFLKLGGYSDAAERASGCPQVKADWLMETGRYGEASEAYEALGQTEEANRALYLQAGSLAAEGRREEAAEMYRRLGEYGDSAVRLKQLEADGLYADGDLAGAWEIYATLDAAYRTHEADYAALYAGAEQALENHEYETAQEAFLKLGGYSDAAERASGCPQAKADWLMETGRYGEASEAYEALGQTEDANRALYLQAGSLAAEGRREEAAELYRRLGEYGDSASLLRQTEADGLYADGDLAGAWEIYASLEEAYRTHGADYTALYAEAEEALKRGQYDRAAEIFRSLGSYPGASVRAKAALSAKADHLLAEGRYAEAREAYASLKDAEYASRTLYDYAGRLSENGDYDSAAAVYTELGDFLDSAALAARMPADKLYASGDLAGAWEIYAGLEESGRIHEADYARLYAEAEARLAEDDFDGAAAQFAALGTYSDAAERAVRCRKDKAARLLQEGRFDEAEALYIELGDQEQAWQAAYSRALQLSGDGEYVRAAEAFEALGDYADSAERAKAARYLSARQALEAGEPEAAREIFAGLGEYRNSAEMIRECDYRIADARLEAGRTEEAREAFLALGDYRDSADKLTECDYRDAEALLEAGRYEEAREAFLALGDYSDAAERAEAARQGRTAAYRIPGSVVTFGAWPVGDQASPIEWIVLASEGDRCLLLSRRIISLKPFHRSAVHGNWKDSSLRDWLNGDFLGAAFSEEEQKAILTTSVSNAKDQANPDWPPDKTYKTQDRVFILSYHEAFEVYGTDVFSLSAEPTEYIDGKYGEGRTGGWWWWLRSPAHRGPAEAVVGQDGKVGYQHVLSDGGVRPALWLDLNADCF